ncbi:hypothetical protein [Thermococcus stetteri]|uniref:hypothetical protein n=1 Tax=Thermococcus stetteri TaxID=49900 RepID=UPI001AE85BFA|nr:hypothetical protein [Thermococcus stetteri]MBP1910787.1 hypothetical protein [Thermococcus stetteri]
MKAETLMKILPQIEEIEGVDFSQFNPPYPGVIDAFKKSGRKGLVEFQRFVEEIGLGKEVVRSFLVSLFQYLLIRYRRFNEYTVVKPAVKVFITLKGWLNENGFERDWEKLLSSFVGYLVSMLPMIVENEDCETAGAYAVLIAKLAKEAMEKFNDEYYDELFKATNEILNELKEKCGTDVSAVEKEKVC